MLEKIDVKRMREEASLSQWQVARILGIPQTDVSRIERGNIGIRPEKAEKIVDMLKALGPEGLRKKYLEALGVKPAETPAAEAAPEPKKPIKVKRGKERAKALTPAITLELRAFCRKHGLSISDAAAELGQTTQFTGFVFSGQIKLSAPQVETLRRKMAAYKPTEPGQFKPAFDHSIPGYSTHRKAASDANAIIDIMGSIDALGLSTRAHHGIRSAGLHTVHQLIHAREVDLLKIKNFGFKSLKEVKAALADYGLKLGTVSAKEEPAKPPVAAPIKLSEPEQPVAPPPPKEPAIKLFVLEGQRLNNGENIAPLLKIDGKTMHVFTLVPGGVFVSYVEAQME